MKSNKCAGDIVLLDFCDAIDNVESVVIFNMRTLKTVELFKISKTCRYTYKFQPHMIIVLWRRNV